MPARKITAEMLPADIGELVPATPAGVRGEKLMSLPLREAREVFEREYLVAQLNRFSRQYFAHGRIHRNGALGACTGS